MALIEKLNAIGDAIREKTGGTEKLTLVEMAEAIKAIEAGGGGMISAGSFTMSADSYQYVVVHGLGTRPQIIVAWVPTYENTAGYFSGGIGIYNVENVTNTNAPIYAKTASINGQYFSPASTEVDITDKIEGKTSDLGAFFNANQSTFSVGYNGGTTLIPSGWKLRAGQTYNWVCVGG